MYYTFKVVRTNLYELYIMNHERFINIITIFDQSSVLLAEKQICGDWRIKDLLINRSTSRLKSVTVIMC